MAVRQLLRNLPKRKRLPSQKTIRPVLPKRKKIVIPSGIRTRQKPEPTVGTTISNSCQSAYDLIDRPRVRLFDLLRLESGAGRDKSPCEWQMTTFLLTIIIIMLALGLVSYVSASAQVTPANKG